MKKCCKCGLQKPETKDFFHVRTKGKLKGICKLCRSIESKQKYPDIKNRMAQTGKEWRERNKERVNSNQVMTNSYIRAKLNAQGALPELITNDIIILKRMQLTLKRTTNEKQRITNNG